MKSAVIGGVSISCTETSSKGIMAGAGVCVVKGYGRDLGRGAGEAGDQLALAGVRTAQEDRRARPLPRNPQAVAFLLAAPFSEAISRLTLAIFDFRSAWRWSVPLCLGISWSMTWRHFNSSSSEVARR